MECQRLYTVNIKLKDEISQLRQFANPRKYLQLQKKVEHLHWQLNKVTQILQLLRINIVFECSHQIESRGTHVLS